MLKLKLILSGNSVGPHVRFERPCEKCPATNAHGGFGEEWQWDPTKGLKGRGEGAEHRTSRVKGPDLLWEEGLRPREAFQLVRRKGKLFESSRLIVSADFFRGERRSGGRAGQENTWAPPLDGGRGGSRDGQHQEQAQHCKAPAK